MIERFAPELRSVSERTEGLVVDLEIGREFIDRTQFFNLFKRRHGGSGGRVADTPVSSPGSLQRSINIVISDGVSGYSDSPKAYLEEVICHMGGDRTAAIATIARVMDERGYSDGQIGRVMESLER